MVKADLDLVEQQYRAWSEAGGAVPVELDMAFAAYGKAGLAVGRQVDDLYTIRVPNPAADAALHWSPGDTTFVGYLRLSFRSSGFPGWAHRLDAPTRELFTLTDGLLPI